ncbi:hypothetical protein FRC12_013814 [Ceratobasidium sp. 428]|nr:hypothetical protein FRC12_013814 [Ceratobasidium sp. 428]
MPTSLNTRSNNAYGSAHQSSYPHPVPPASHTQVTTTTSPPTRHTAHTFDTSLRSADARYHPVVSSSRYDQPHHAPNPINAPSGNSALPVRVKAPSRVGQASRAAFTTSPSERVQMYPDPPQAYSNPPVGRSPQPQAGPSSSAMMSTSHYSYQAAPSTSTPTSTLTPIPSTSLVPPTALTHLHRRSPELPKLETQPGPSPRPSTAASANRQATYIDSPIDFYSQLGSRFAALPPTSAYENSPQSSVPAGPLISITTPVVTPIHNQSFETQQQQQQQRQPHVHPQRYLPAHQVQQQGWPQPRSYHPTVRMCAVCFEYEPTVRFAERSPTADCAHGATVCVGCLEYHILFAIHRCGNMDVQCPHEGCGKQLEYWDVYASVRDWNYLGYYEALLLRREMEAEKDFVWCKNPQCKGGQIHRPGKSNPIVICETCRAKSCFVHDRPWHEGLTCEQFDKQRRDEVHDKATAQYIAQNTKPCPNCGKNVSPTSPLHVHMD